MMADQIDYVEMRRLRDLGLSNREIAKQLGCSESSVQKVCRRLGWPKRCDGRAREIDLPLLFKLWGENVAVEDIARRLGVSISTMYLLRKRHALPPRTPREREGYGSKPDPTPDEIERLKLELKEKHLAERMAETDDTVRSKVMRWGRGEYAPQGGRA